MINEMRRPCTLIDYRDCEPTPNEITIDALTVTSVDVKCVVKQGVEYFYYVVSYRPEQDYSESQFGGRMRFVFGEQFLSIKKALNDAMRVLDAIEGKRNAPVLATEEVLAGLPKDAKAFVVLSTGNMCKMTWAKDCWEIRDGDYYMEVEPEDSFRIIADKNDPKTAEYLRNNFTLDGVRIKEKETSHD